MKNKNQKKQMNQMTKEELEQMERVFSKKNFLTYLSCVFLSPYGIFRIIRTDSLKKSEKVLWIMISILCMYTLLRGLL